MAICDANEQSMASVGRPDCEIEEKSTDKLHLIYQKLIIKHNKLKKLSLWGCSGLDVSSLDFKFHASTLMFFDYFLILFIAKCRHCI